MREMAPSLLAARAWITVLQWATVVAQHAGRTRLSAQFGQRKLECVRRLHQEAA